MLHGRGVPGVDQPKQLTIPKKMRLFTRLPSLEPPNSYDQSSLDVFFQGHGQIRHLKQINCTRPGYIGRSGTCQAAPNGEDWATKRQGTN